MPAKSLGNVALSAVSRQGPMHWQSLAGYLMQRHGASADEANRAILHLVQAGALVQTDSYVLSAGHHHERAPGRGSNMLGIATSVTGIVAGILAIIEILFRTGTLQGPSPIQAVEQWAWPSFVTPVVHPGQGDIVIPSFPTDRPARPRGLSLSGDCDTGFTLGWQAVAGAGSYRIERDGSFFGTARQQTWFTFAAFPDNQAHRYTVAAVSQFGVRSRPSEPVQGSACTFQ